VRTILKYNEYLNMESEEKYFQYGTIIKMNLVDSSGENVKLNTELSEIGCSLSRTNIYYKFKVLESNSKKYPVGSELVFPIKFDKQKFNFTISIPYTYLTGGYGSAEKHYSAYVELG